MSAASLFLFVGDERGDAVDEREVAGARARDARRRGMPAEAGEVLDRGGVGLLRGGDLPRSHSPRDDAVAVERGVERGREDRPLLVAHLRDHDLGGARVVEPALEGDDRPERDEPEHPDPRQQQRSATGRTEGAYEAGRRVERSPHALTLGSRIHPICSNRSTAEATAAGSSAHGHVPCPRQEQQAPVGQRVAQRLGVARGDDAVARAPHDERRAASARRAGRAARRRRSRYPPRASRGPARRPSAAPARASLSSVAGSPTTRANARSRRPLRATISGIAARRSTRPSAWARGWRHDGRTAPVAIRPAGAISVRARNAPGRSAA